MVRKDGERTMTQPVCHNMAAVQREEEREGDRERGSTTDRKLLETERERDGEKEREKETERKRERDRDRENERERQTVTWC